MPNQILPRKIRRARELRREQTVYEKDLWEILRAHRLEGFKFRRQHPIGPYIADFVCIAAKLVIELDGNSHDERADSDANRDFVLGELGWTTLRFPNTDARDNPDGLWSEIETEIRARL